MTNHPNRSKRHTPGPWALFNKNRTIAVTAGEGPHNEVVHWSGFDASHYPAQALANARLISAAPELYEAVLALLPKSWAKDDTMEHLPGVKIARAAIAKARGKD